MTCTLEFIDSFSHYATADIASKYNYMDGTLGLTIDNSGRGSSKCLLYTTPGYSRTVGRTVTQTQYPVIGAAFKFAGPTATDCYIEFRDVNTVQCFVNLNRDGTFSIKRGSTVLGTSVGALSANVWYFIEFRAKIDNSAGSAELVVNGVSWINLTGINTRSTANNYSNVFDILIGSTTASRVCDLYYGRGTGVSGDFLGDVSVKAYFPNGVGALSQFTPIPAGDNYTNVDDTTPDGDTTYVTTSGIGLIDTYTFQDLVSVSGIIYGVQDDLYARKDDAGTRMVCNIYRYGGVNYSGAPISLTDTYLYNLTIRQNSPVTGTRWTTAEFNDGEFGQRLDS